MVKKLVLSFFVLFYIISVEPALAHPGNTAADGCHYCRTNCDSWGVPWYERHCHGGNAVPVVEEEPTYASPTSAPIIKTVKLIKTKRINFSCAGKKYCSQMRSCQEAYYYLQTCGLKRLDGDKDGVPCEHICR